MRSVQFFPSSTEGPYCNFVTRWNSEFLTYSLQIAAACCVPRMVSIISVLFLFLFYLLHIHLKKERKIKKVSKKERRKMGKKWKEERKGGPV